MDEQKRALWTKLVTSPVDVPTGRACSRCLHTAESHMHGDPLACAYCALGPISHASGLACSFYMPRTTPASGASCRAPRCHCTGYLARGPEAR